MNAGILPGDIAIMDGDVSNLKDGDIVLPLFADDDKMVLVARDVAKQIEEELDYPGQIKVNVIRESRVTDYAK